MNTIINKTFNKIKITFNYTDYEIAKLKYILTVFISEFSKLLLMFLFFSYFNKTIEFIISLLTLLTIRTFSGGLHLKNYITCFIFSLSFFILCIMILPNIPLLQFTSAIILSLSLLINYNCSPVYSIDRSEYSKEQKKSFRNISSVIILIYSIVLLIYKNNPYADYCIWVILIQNVQLLFSKRKEVRYEKEY